jgi:membrane-associated phospholipid phosphatase
LKVSEIFADIFIQVGNPYLMGLLFLIGLYFKNYRGLFLTAALCAGFSLWFNPILKEFWQIPLKSGTHTYAFPSGHGHTVSSFFAVLLFGLPRNYTLAIIAALICYAFSINIRGYHEWLDIIGGQYIGIIQGLLFFWMYRCCKAHFLK